MGLLLSAVVVAAACGSEFGRFEWIREKFERDGWGANEEMMKKKMMKLIARRPGQLSVMARNHTLLKRDDDYWFPGGHGCCL